METTTAPTDASGVPGAPGRSRRWLGLPRVARRVRRALSPSERHVRTVWVVSFAPFEERASMGGFEWRYSWADADVLYDEQVAASIACGGSHEVRLVPYRSSLTGDALTDEIDADLYLIEVDLPAAREFVPGRV